MIRFDSDYCEGAHPKVLQKLIDTNLDQTAGYGDDPYCKLAIQLIKDKCNRQDVDVHLFVGGTQANLTFISAALRPHQAVITADTGHINVHESGAIEATGHKILALPNEDGKLTAYQIQRIYDDHYNDENLEHTVQPKLVYISHPTENGSIYSKAELTAISEICRKNNLILYMDGARLGYALCAMDNDLDLPAIAKLCDAFYIGGTKNGALFGEALVICMDSVKKDFRYIIKQKGGMLAKSRLLGVQFIALLEDNLYFELATHSNKMATLIKEACINNGLSFLTPSSTNQQFPIMTNEMLKRLKEKYQYCFWKEIDKNHSAVRFCTSWATKTSEVEELVTDIKNIYK